MNNITAANSANSANLHQKSNPRIRKFRGIRNQLDEECIEEMQFLREERAAIREFDGGMTREQAEYFGILDVPCLPIRNTNVNDE